MRWTIRFFGMFNVVILARLLTPEDFGLIAMSSIFIALVTTLTDGSVDHAIARAKDPTVADYNSAWTLQILVGIVNAIVILALSPLFVWLFNDDRLQTLFIIGAFAPLIIGFENIGTVNFRRSLQFDKEYRYWVIRKVMRIVITITLALILRNYFAMALAAPIGAVFIVALSFIMSDYRPQLDFSRISQIWDFSKWLIIIDSSRLLERRGDEFAASLYGIADQVGHYSVASDLATMPTREIIEPLDRVLLPALAPHRDARQILKPLLASALTLIIAISCATGVGMYLIADPFVRLFLGNQWIESIAFFETIALSAVGGGIALGMRPVLLVIGEEKRLAWIYALSLLVFMPVFVYLAATGNSFLALAQARIALAIWLVIGSLSYIVRSGLLPFKALIFSAWRPLFATLVMFGSVRFGQQIPVDGLVPILMRDILIGTIAFITTMLVTWRIFSQSAGPESNLYERAGKAVKSKFGR